MSVDASPQSLTQSIVPFERFGMVLSASRSRNDSSLTGLARASRRRFLPDDLAQVERGERVLDDDQVIELASLYRLQPRFLSAERPLVVHLDGSTTQELGNQTGHYDDVETIIHRLVVVEQLTADATSRPTSFDLQPLGQAFGLSSATVNMMAADRSNGSEPGGVGWEALADRVIVPEAGIKIGATPMGTLTLIRSRPDRGSTKVLVPSACTLGEFCSYLV